MFKLRGPKNQLGQVKETFLEEYNKEESKVKKELIMASTAFKEAIHIYRNGNLDAPLPKGIVIPKNLETIAHDLQMRGTKRGRDVFLGSEEEEIEHRVAKKTEAELKRLSIHNTPASTKRVVHAPIEVQVVEKTTKVNPPSTAGKK